MGYLGLDNGGAGTARKIRRAEWSSAPGDLFLRAANLIRALCGDDIGGSPAPLVGRAAAVLSLCPH